VGATGANGSVAWSCSIRRGGLRGQESGHDTEGRADGPRWPPVASPGASAQQGPGQPRTGRRPTWGAHGLAGSRRA